MAQERRRDKVASVTMVLFSAATVGAISALLSIGGKGSSARTTPRDWIVVPGDSLAFHLRRLDSLEVQTSVLRSRMEIVQSEAAAVDSLQLSGRLRDLARIRAELGALRGRADTLDRIILRDPAKAVELVVLRSEVEGIRQQMMSTVGGIRYDIDRVYDITKWVLGIILVLAIGNLIGPFLSRRRAPPSV